MGLLEEFGKRQWYKEGKGKPEISGKVEVYFHLLRTHFWKLITLNILFVFFSIPIITMPGALVSLNRVCIILVRDRNVFLWDEFFKEFKRSVLKSIPVGIMYLLILFLSYYTFSLGISSSTTTRIIGFYAVGFILLFTAMLWGGYSFVLLAMFDLPNIAILKNAFILLVIDIKSTLWSFLTLFISVALVTVLFPLSIIPLVFCVIGLTQYTLCYFVNTPAQNWIIEPNEKRKVQL